MYKIKIFLYIVSFDLSKVEQCFVSLDSNKFIPLSIEINENNHISIENILQQIFEEHINLGFGWVDIKLIDAFKSLDTMHITYACSIPPNSPLKNAYYVSKNISIIDRLARKALYYA